MKATFENTNSGDHLTLDGTLCDVRSKGESVSGDRTDTLIRVGMVSVHRDSYYTPEEFDAAGYLHLSGKEV